MNSPIIGCFVGIGIVLYTIFTDVIPQDWIVSMVGGAIFGACLAQVLHELRRP